MPRPSTAAVRNGWPAKLPRDALLGLAAAALPLALLHGFTVDDALIIARYAAHIAEGEGYRFNAQDAASDGLTPLGFAYLLAPFARGGVLEAFRAARLLGAIAWLSASMVLGVAIGRVSSSPLRYGALLLVLTSAPLAAWSIAGLETGVAIALATLAVAIPKASRLNLLGSLAAGLLAWLRPEALPFALVLGVGRGAGRGSAKSILLAALPSLLTIALRLLVFGRPFPLSVLAKPSDLLHGATYAFACALLTGGPIAAFAPLAIRKADPFARVLLLASFAHFAAVTLAGGDWMPLSRLITVALPALALASAHLLSVSRATVALPRLALALAGTVFVFARMGESASRVLDDRLALIEQARPQLAPFARIAALDIGWLGAATSSHIVDLAGVTSLEIAALPGGHTSKPVSLTMLERREVDALVTLDPPRTVEARLLSDRAFTEAFEPVWTSPSDLRLRYTLWQRKKPSESGLEP